MREKSVYNIVKVPLLITLDIKMSGLDVKNVTFAEISELSAVGLNLSFDGLIGLAFSQLADVGVTTIFQYFL